MLRLEGHEDFQLSRLELWDHMTDMEFLSRMVPDLERVVRSEPGVLVCRVRPGFSFLRGSLEITFETTKQQPPALVEMRVLGKGIGSSVSVLTSFELVELASDEMGKEPGSNSNGKTRLHWTAEVQELGGLLKPISRDLVKAAAGRIVAQIWTNVQQELAPD